MKKTFLIIIVAICLGFIIVPLIKKKTVSNIAKKALVVSVRAVPIQVKTLSKHILAYGVVEAKPGKTKIVSLSFDALINKLFVIDGQNVKKNQVLFMTIPSSTAKIQLLQAENAFRLSQENLKLTNEKFKMHLVSAQNVLDAQNAFNQAKIAYENLAKEYKSKVLSPIDGIITKINYSEGSFVVRGNPILEIANTHDIIIKCGVEPEDINNIKLHTPVSISLIDYNKKISGEIISISNNIDPSTHLINVYVLPSLGEQLLLNSYAQVTIPIFKYTGLTVPKSALLYENGHFVIYTVKNGTAHKHIVNVVVKNHKYAQITSYDISKGELVVTQGAYELKNNMKVRLEK